MRGHRKQVFQEITLFGGAAPDPLAAASLLTIRIDIGPLYVALMRHGDYDLLVGDQLLDAEVPDRFDYFGSPFADVLLLHFEEIFANDIANETFLAQDSLVLINLSHQLAVLPREFLDLQPRQALQLH